MLQSRDYGKNVAEYECEEGSPGMDDLLEQIMKECRAYTSCGEVASYIPELSKSNKEHLGIYILNSDKKSYHAGDYNVEFTIQSIIKPVMLLQVLIDNGIEFVQSKIGVEATGKPFDAINMTDQKLLSSHLNPMVNMGAIAMCNLIKGKNYTEKFDRLLQLVRRLANNAGIILNEEVYQSEKATGNKNRSLSYLLKCSGMLEDDVEDVLECYFKACSISVNCKDLANIAYMLANHGRCMNEEERIFESEYGRYVNAVLTTCGMYDGSGAFAVNVGIPAKSGVGGGIMAVVPTRMGIGIYSPGLDSKGNSVAGIKVLEALSHRMFLSIF